MKKLIKTALLTGADVNVTLDPTHPDVDLPRHLLGHELVTLVIGYNLRKPIPDLALSAVAFSATLSFGYHGQYNLLVPWDARKHVSSEGRMLSGPTAPEGPLAQVIDLAAYKRRKAQKDGLR
jgi:hypothetical protein